MELNFAYIAFISYKREDKKWAQWLHRKLEHYKLPNKTTKPWKRNLTYRYLSIRRT